MSNTAEVIQFNKNEIAAFSEFRSQLAELKHNNSKAVFIYTDPKGNKEARSHIYKLRQTKSAVERVRKEQKAEALEYGRKVDNQAKEIVIELDGMIEIHETPLREIEEKEAARVQAHKDRIETLVLYRQAEGVMSAEEIKACITKVEQFLIDDSLQEFKSEAALVKDQAITELKSMLDMQQKYEDEQAELARLRAQAAAQEQKDREEKIAREAREAAERIAAEQAAAKERERLQAEMNQQLELERAKREKLEAEQRAEAAAKAAEQAAIEAKAQAKRDAEEAVKRAEAARQAQEDAEKAAAAKREANKKHQASINNAAVQALMSAGLSEADAKTAITAIAKREVPNVSINY